MVKDLKPPTARGHTPARIIAVVLVALLAAAGCAQLVADSIDALIRQGIDLFTARRYDEAITKFLEVVRRDPKSWTAYLYMARSYVAKASWGDALASGRKALELAPDRADVIPTLADALLGAGLDAFNRGQLSGAIPLLAEYVTLRPTDPAGYLHLGKAFLGSGAYGDALRTIVQGLAHASDASTRAQLVRSLLDGGGQALAAGHAKSAIGLLQEYVRHETGNVSAYLALGKAYWQDGSMGNALSAFRRVLELNPGNTEALQFLGPRR
jgi:tetratricopeptide (TPR) repeat protein